MTIIQIHQKVYGCLKNKVPADNFNLTVDNNGVFNSQPFRFKADLVEETVDDVNNTIISVRNKKIVVSLKHLIKFWRLLEMLLIK